MQVDEKIADWLRIINSFSFVKTIFSCQGHYCKKPQQSIVYYVDYEETIDSIFGFSSYCKSRVKYPYVLLNFSSTTSTRAFVCEWLRSRLDLYENDILLYYITEKKRPLFNRYITPCIIISKFDDVYVSISFIIAKKLGSTYYKNKKRLDDKLRRLRKVLFYSITRNLEITEERIG